MALRFDGEQTAEMLAIQRQLAEVLLRVNRERRPEAALAVFALVRLAKELLDKYPLDTKRALLFSACIPYLVGEDLTGPGRILTVQ